MYSSPSPSESLIAYTSCEFVTNYTSNADTEIAIIDWITLERKRLTDTAAYDFFPVWSPNGEYIVFLSVTGPIYRSIWLDSSERIVITVIDAKGNLKAKGRGALLHPAAWSPSNQEFAFIDIISINEGTSYCEGPVRRIGIFLTGIDDIEPRQIASAISCESPLTRLNSITFGGPSWSPDGSEIAFGSSDYADASVHIVGKDGANERVIWRGASSKPISQVAWSPDGDDILFIADAARIVRPDGSGLRELELPYGEGPRQLDVPYEYSIANFRAAWSPDSSQIAIYDGEDTIVLVNRDGAVVRIYEVPCERCAWGR